MSALLLDDHERRVRIRLLGTAQVVHAEAVGQDDPAVLDDGRRAASRYAPARGAVLPAAVVVVVSAANWTNCIDAGA